MLGKRSDWSRWLLVLVTLVVGLRGGAYLLLPLLPDAFAWGSAIMLGASLTFFLLPLPHEAALQQRERSPRLPDEPPLPSP